MPCLSIGAVSSLTHEDVSETTQDSSVSGLSVCKMYLTSSGNRTPGVATPVVVRWAAKRTMRVSAGAAKVQLALALPDGVVASSSAVSGPPVAHPLATRPSGVGAGNATHPAAPLGTPVGPLQENTV
jgi:hypothetical protein